MGEMLVHEYLTRHASTSVLIVCGDCSGDGPDPITTVLTKAGCCASCGGKSFVLASTQQINPIQEATDMSTSSILEQLKPYGINPQEVKIIEGHPWLDSDQLATIARHSGEFREISSDYLRREEDQLIYRGTVIDKEGRSYSRTGVATIGERLRNGEEVNPHTLAETRALRSTLAFAGFDVLKSGSVAPLAPLPVQAESQGASRRKNLAQLHILAEERGLIVKGQSGVVDMTGYRAWLLEEFGVVTSADFTEEDFAKAINKLKAMQP